jgi:hypothetical protein
MRNVTITLDNETAAQAKVHAAERGMSLSRYIGEVLRRELRNGDIYDAAYRSWRAGKAFPLSGDPSSPPEREELYDRSVLRRR